MLKVPEPAALWKKGKIMEDVSEFSVLEGELLRIRTIFETQERILGELREISPGNPTIEDLPDLFRSKIQSDPEEIERLKKGLADAES